MKRIILSIVVLTFIVVSVSSCKTDSKKEEVKTEVIEKKEEIKTHEIANATYQCPMKCEEEKTYNKPGQCPVCKMDLKEVELNKDKEDHLEGDDHDHDHGPEGNEG